MKDVGLVGLTGLIGAGTGAMNILADAAGVEMPWPAQFGLCGLFGGLLWWTMAKTIPKISEDNKAAAVEAARIHADSYRSVSDGLARVEAAISTGNEAQLGMLHALVQNTKSGS